MRGKFIISAVVIALLGVAGPAVADYFYPGRVIIGYGFGGGGGFYGGGGAYAAGGGGGSSYFGNAMNASTTKGQRVGNGEIKFSW